MPDVFAVPLSMGTFIDVMNDDSTLVLRWHDPHLLQEGSPYLVCQYRGRPFRVRRGADRGVRYLLPYPGDVTALRPLETPPR